MFVTGLSSASLTSNNNMVVESFNEQFIANANVGNFSVVESYAFPSTKGRRLGGGSIVGDNLLLVVNAEQDNAYLASVPVVRDGKL